MKEISYSAVLGFATGAYLNRFLRGAWQWDAAAWAVIIGLSIYIYVIWLIDNRNEP